MGESADARARESKVCFVRRDGGSRRVVGSAADEGSCSAAAEWREKSRHDKSRHGTTSILRR